MNRLLGRYFSILSVLAEQYFIEVVGVFFPLLFIFPFASLTKAVPTHFIKQLPHTPENPRLLLLSKRFPSTIFTAKDPINISGASILFTPKGFM